MISGRGRSVTNCDRFPGRDPLISSVPAETRVARAHFAVVVVYFGPLPKWMNLHLATCAANPDVDWVILSDHPCPPRPPNVHLFPMSLQHFRALARERLGMPVAIETPYKICDFKPAFGVILDEYLRRYDFWAHSDLDICWGRIRRFITDADLHQYDIISAAPYQICGHFTLYRNDSRVNNLFRANGEHQRVFQEPKHLGFDEIGEGMRLEGFTSTILELQRRGDVRVTWRPLALERSISPTWADGLTQLHRGRIEPTTLFRYQPVTRCYLHAGRVLTIPRNSEVMYFHFRNWGSNWPAVPGSEATTTRRWILLSPTSATVHSTLFGLLPSHLDRWVTGARLSAAWLARTAFRRLRTSVRRLASFGGLSRQ
jgi:hypothetical protein